VFGKFFKLRLLMVLDRFVPRYFENDISKGYAKLTEEGWKAVQEELEEETSSSCDVDTQC
jgi:hypothetical protein